MPFKIYYNEYPPSIGNSKEEENPEPLTYKICHPIQCSYFTHILFKLILRDFNHYPFNKKEYVLPYKFNSLTKSSNKIKKK